MIHAAFLLAAAVAAPASLPPRPPDATYSYALQLGGTALGSSTVVVDGSTPGTIVVKESASMSIPRYTATTTMRYDAATLLETAYTADFNLPGGTQHTVVTVKPGAMTVTATPTGGTADIPADPSAPLEIISDNLAGSSIMVPAILHATGAKAFTLAVLSGAKPLVCKVVPDPLPSRPAFVPASDVELALEIAGNRFIYWYDPATYVVHDIAIPAQQADYRLTATTAPGAAPPPAAAPPPSPLPTPTPHFSSRDVHFTSADGTVLAGTLTVPDRGRAPFAAVVFVHGSGAQDRDETIGPNPIFLQLSNALSNAGYAVLRYDKRGVAKSGGANTAGTRDELLDDVKAAYRFVRARSEIDPKHVYLLGHSEGGELVPTVAAHEPGVAGIILMAPPSRPLWQVSMQQFLAGAPPERRAAMEQEELAALDKLRHGTEAKDAWYRSSMDLDPVVDIARVRAPILILQGEGDAQVSAKDLPRLANAARAANRDVTVRTFSNDNHLFEAIVPGDPQTPLTALKQYLTVPAWIDARVLDTLTTWMARHARADVAR
ncbi:MAG: lysophospholipase [Candidatus Eremiobacteraeota bacterium]|nr:lysophospholipase [Candidatus Eremiobacteraeota bacterium]